MTEETNNPFLDLLAKDPPTDSLTTAIAPVQVPKIIPKVHLTREDFAAALPKQVKGRISNEVMETINDMLADPHSREGFRDNLVGFSSILSGGKYKLGSYVEAVRYVSFKMMGFKNKEAYQHTFPARFNLLIAEGADDKKISAYVAMYNKNKLVMQIFEQSLIPTHILNADNFQKAINKQVTLMTTAASELVQQKAADSLMTHLKAPETKKIELDIGIKEGSTIDELRAVTQALAAQQQATIKAGGATAQKIAHSQIIEIKAEED